MLLGLLGGAAKAVLGAGRKSTRKVNAKAFSGKAAKEGGEKKVDKTQNPDISKMFNTTTTAVVDVKTDAVKKISASGLGKDPLALQVETLFYRTVDIRQALADKQEAKKKKIAAQNAKAEKNRRSLRESILEGAAGLGTGAVTKASGALGLGNLWDNIMKTLGILFAGWLIQYLPQIISFVEKFIDIAEKIINVVWKVLKPVLGALWWITKSGAKLVATLVGVDPEEAQKQSFLKNLTEIQKRVPVVEAAFAAFAILQAKGSFTKEFGRDPTKPGDGTGGKKKLGGDKTDPATKRLRDQKARELRRKRRARDNFRKLQRRGKKFKTNVMRKMGRGPRRILKGVGKSLGKVGKVGGKLLKGLSKISKFAKFPIIGPLIIAVTQIIAGEGIKKAAFMGLGAAIGGGLGIALGAVFPPAAMITTIIGEGIGAFVGELLYEGFLGKGWGAAKDKLVNTITGFFTGVGKVGKMVWDWVTKGGLWTMIKNVAGGIGAVFKWIFSGPGGGGLLDLLGKGVNGLKALAKFIFRDVWVLLWKGASGATKFLWDWLKGGGLQTLAKGIAGGAMSLLRWLLTTAVPWAVKAAGNAGKALWEWAKGGFDRFIGNFPMIKMPTTSIGDMLTGLFDKFLGPVMDWKIMPDVDIKVKPGDSSKWAIDPRRHFGGVEVKAKLQSLRDLLAGMTWGIPDILGGIFKHIPLLKNLVKDGKVEGIPNLALLTPLGMPFLMPHLIKSFFPGMGGAIKNAATTFTGGSTPGSPTEGSPLQTPGDDQSEGVTPTEDNTDTSDSITPKSSAPATDSISESASYDKPGGSKGGEGGLMSIPIPAMQGGAAGGGGTGGGRVGSDVNKYDAIAGLNKALILAKLYRG